MPIPYSLFKNNLTPEPDDHAAIVQTYRSVGFEEIASRMIDQGSTVNKPDILAVLDDMEKACESILLEGNRVVLGGLVQMFPRIRGVFVDETDEFDPARHQLDVGANPGRRVRKALRKDGTVEKLFAESPTPKVGTFRDVATGLTNSLATPGSIANVTGKDMQFDVAQPDEGLFFAPLDGGSAVQVTTISQNLPKLQIFQIPSLAPGSYKFEVRARMKDGSELRVGLLQSTLTVQ